jgi:hypothetical protein
MSKVKEYTFKDWLKGNITPIKEGAHPVLKGEHGRIISLSATKQLSKADAIQIQDAKEEAFNIAVKQGVRVLYVMKKQTMAKAELPDKYLQSVIDEINAELNDNPKILQRIYSGDISTDAIDINLYKKIIEYGDKGVLHSNLWQKNELYRLKCRYLLREKLKESQTSNAENKNELTEPSQVARAIKSNTKSKDKTYSVADITFALEVFLKNYKDAFDYKEVCEIAKESKGCPDVLKHEKAYKRMLSWFHTFEDEAGIKLK